MSNISLSRANCTRRSAVSWYQRTISSSDRGWSSPSAVMTARVEAGRCASSQGRAIPRLRATFSAVSIIRPRVASTTAQDDSNSSAAVDGTLRLLRSAQSYSVAPKA